MPIISIIPEMRKLQFPEHIVKIRTDSDNIGDSRRE